VLVERGRHPSPVWRTSVNGACRQRFSPSKKASLPNFHFSFERVLLWVLSSSLLYYYTYTMTGSSNSKIGQPGSKSGLKKPTMTKEERREKYTAMARKRREKMQNRGSRHHGSKEGVCYQCRQTGHSVGNCPMKGNGASENSELLCYKCGSTKHSLSSCQKRSSSNELPFATCFICKEKGHLASGCAQNEKGIYVNGGSCRFCDSRDHLATVCPDKKKKKKSDPTDEVDINDLLEEPTTTSKKAETKVAEMPKKRRVVKF
jgi:hypothetical protein